jgi:ubiquitin carboxyl-terminal hydrolase 36/42
MQNYKIGAGLSNLGNTCFFNAAVQTILYTKPLFEYLESKAHSEKCRKKDWCLFCELEKMHFETQRNKVHSPVSMVKNLKTIFKKVTL